MIKQENYSRELGKLSKNKSYYQYLIKQYKKDCRIQTSLELFTSAGDKDTNENVIDTGNGAIENAEVTLEVFSGHFAKQGSRNEPSIVNSRSSKRRRIDEMELQNLKAKNETEQ